MQILPSKRAADPPRIGTPVLLASGRELSKSTLFYLLHFSGWITFGTVWFASDFTTKGLLPAAMENLLWWICGGALTLGFRKVYQWVRSTPRSFATYGSICLLLSVAAAPVWYSVAEASVRLGYLGLSRVPSTAPLIAAAAHTDSLAPLWIPYRDWIFFASVLFTWSALYFGINAMLDLETERANVARALKLADTARLRALQSNLNPHFIFNTLNGIATLIRERDTTAASAMVDALGEFLRTTLQRTNSPEIQVADELQLIQKYLQIQRSRFGDRLHCIVQVDSAATDALIPTLILQPLVENGILHGVLPRVEGGTLWISIQKQGETLILSVEDDGQGPTKGLANSLGVGLSNSIERLNALYGATARLDFGARAEGGGFAVVIRMPYRSAQALRGLASAEALPA
jgi:two-component sensor histidine kinase